MACSTRSSNSIVMLVALSSNGSIRLERDSVENTPRSAKRLFKFMLYLICFDMGLFDTCT